MLDIGTEDKTADPVMPLYGAFDVDGQVLPF